MEILVLALGAFLAFAVIASLTALSLVSLLRSDGGIAPQAVQALVEALKDLIKRIL